MSLYLEDQKGMHHENKNTSTKSSQRPTHPRKMARKKGGKRKKSNRGRKEGYRFTQSRLMELAARNGYARARKIRDFRKSIEDPELKLQHMNRIAKMKRWCMGPGQYFNHRGAFKKKPSMSTFV
jgi:hypothetical protein